MHPAMSDLNFSIVYQVPEIDCSGLQASTPSQLSASVCPSLLSTLLSLITIWRVVVLLLVLGNIKNIPLIWHVSTIVCFVSTSLMFNQLRIVNAFRFCLRTQRPKVSPTSDQLFQPLITTSHAPIMEIDFNLHSQQ